ncbi:S1 RNA-binding domain-containing protein 1 [Zophobas morio]|uniref:S1 RNA-binding domain-containing protein 1 n=1 Tax=Zophobas morio TaxID=2755281 RepID=UPI0030834872
MSSLKSPNLKRKKTQPLKARTKRAKLEIKDEVPSCSTASATTKKVKVKNEEDTKIKKAKTKESVKTVCDPQWTEYELLAEQYSLQLNVAKNVIELFEEGNTIPFIARYRRNATNNMTAEELRATKETYEEILTLKNKMTTVIKNLEKSAALTEQLKRAVTCSRTIEELEYVYAPYKTGGKRTLAERAKELGLEEPALTILNNTGKVNLYDFILENKDELKDVSAVEKGIVHIIASVMATDTEILSALRELRKNTNFAIKTKKAVTKSTKNAAENKESNEFKFENYLDFEISVKYIKPHQVLAINRGENLKVLSVKVVVPESLSHKFRTLCFNKWVNKGEKSPQRENIMKQAIEDAYSRLVEPLVKREVRSELKQKAERASCDVFSTNLKHLLLATPLKGKAILGIDPGYSNGCKLALISHVGTLVTSGVIYPHKHRSNNQNSEKDITMLKNMLLKYNCELIALGNGTACRQTEEWLTNLIESRVFSPLDIKYTVVREEGASIYSCSPEAKKEFPTLDPNIISAVSLARRVQEPLSELIKIEPKHLGIGMYQHDVKKKQLDEALDDVVSECVSFVGVDLNTASQCLLRHVAGLSEKKAQQIIDHRSKNGPFTSRKQLLDVFGIGEKVFLQCAGFLRVGPLTTEDATTFYKNPKSTKLDCTNVHPESYDTAINIIKKVGLKLGDVGETNFISVIKDKLLKVSELSAEFSSNDDTVQLILDALSKPLNYDFRNDCPKEPVFKKGLTSIGDLASGSVLTGVVNNVTHFGCFVDIGVGTNGLIHVSKCNGLNLQIGHKVEVKVINVDIGKKRIGLQALKLLM